jgi:hypothetical protein
LHGFALLGVPVDLAAYPANDADFPCPQRKAGEKRRMFNIQCSGFWGWMNPIFVSTALRCSYMPSNSNLSASLGKTSPGASSARPEDLVANDHDRLGQVQGGKAGGGDRRDGVAVAQVLVGQAPVFRPEENGDQVVLGDRDKIPGEVPGVGQGRPVGTDAGGCSHHIVKRAYGIEQRSS